MTSISSAIWALWLLDFPKNVFPLHYLLVVGVAFVLFIVALVIAVRRQ